MIKKIGIIGIRGLPAKYGAFDQFVQQFVNYCIEQKKNIKFFISSDYDYKKNNNLKSDDVNQIYLKRPNNFLLIFNYFLSILIFYIKGIRIFMFFGYGASIFFPLLKILNCKIICNVDGIEWRRPNNIFKKKYFKLCEKLVSMLKIIRIYDSEIIKRYYSLKYNAKGILIYYPSDFESFQNQINTSSEDDKKFLIVMRLLPENNIDTIVDAFLDLNIQKPNDFKLYIVGSNNNFFSKKILPKILKTKNITFLGPVYDRKELYKLWSSIPNYIHGHSVGGTNPTLIEAMSLKKNIIPFNSSFNRIILGKNIFYFRNKLDLIKIILEKKYLNKNNYFFKKCFDSLYINEMYLNIILN